MQLVHNKGFLNLIFTFFVLGSFFLSIRVLLIGCESSSTPLEYLISAIPELYLLLMTSYYLVLVWKEKISFKFNLVDKFVLLFLCFNVIVGVILANNLKLSLYGFRMSYLPILFYFFIRFIPLKKDQLIQLIDKIFLLFTFVGLLGIILYFIFFDFMVNMIHKTGSEVAEYFIPRMTSIFWTPVVFGTFMSITFCYFYYKLFQNNPSKRNYLFIAITCFCTFFSISRGSILIMIIGLIIIPILYKKWKPFVYVLPIVVLSFLILGYNTNSPKEATKWIAESYVEAADLEKGVTRVDLWKSALHDFQKKPFGYGLGKSGHIATRFYSDKSDVAAVSSTDGWFIKLANETGFLGLISYFTLAMVFLITTWKSFNLHHTPIIGFTLVIFVLVNIQNLVSNVLDFYLFANFFWLLLGITENIKSGKQFS
jgi:hypothetical protein